MSSELGRPAADASEVAEDDRRVPVTGGRVVEPARRHRRPRRRWRWALAILAVVVLVPVLYVGGTFLQVWRASGWEGNGSADAIVVLGAAQYDGVPSPVLKKRLDHALDLYQRDRAPMIVVTGGKQEGDRFTEAGSGYTYLREHGVPDDALRLEVQGTTTYESVAAARRFLGDEGVDEVILISGPAQSKRLAGIADDLGLRAVISPTSGDASTSSLVRETLIVSAGRILGYRRLDRFDA